MKICSYMEGKMRLKYNIENGTELVAVSYLFMHWRFPSFSHEMACEVKSE